MIITREDLAEVNELLDRVRLYYATPDDEFPEQPGDVGFFADKPHLLMAVGFDEYQALSLDEEFDREDSAADRFGIPRLHDLAFDFESVYRESSSGAWFWYEGMHRDKLHFVGPRKADDRYISTDEWLRTLQSLADAPDGKSRQLWLPQLWTPSAQSEERQALSQHVPALLKDIHHETLSLQQLSPTQLEELLAELLRARGMAVHVTPKTRDGGRDIIARSETQFGEPVVLAVEVKQKGVVGLNDVQRALWANDDFPLVMIATAGRFSAGVIGEKNRNRNFHRLLLKDGVALSQWVTTYAGSADWKNTPL